MPHGMAKKINKFIFLKTKRLEKKNVRYDSSAQSPAMAKDNVLMAVSEGGT